jgi:SOS regulatory protein LexA
MILKDSDQDELCVESEAGREIYTIGQLTQLPVYANIAAGSPGYVSDEIIEYVSLPAEWFKGKEDCFLIKVKGDSMNGANIENEDLVVIQKQQCAQNRDIVVVTIDEEATLKRFISMGDTILLIPENEEYEPILMKSDEIKVVGVALAVIKNTGI